MQGSLLTVIVPIYKAESYLHRCLDSIINQTYKNLEVILVDDGSPDNCPAICDEYAKQDSRVKVIHQKNAGVSAARNAGLDATTGDYIAFVDSDDWLELDAYEILLRKISDEKKDIVAFGYIMEYLNRSINISMAVDTDVFVDELMYGEEDWSVWRFVYRKEIFFDLRFEVGALFEDALIISDIFDRVSTIGIVPKNLYHYNCYNAQSIMHSANETIGRYVCIKAYQKNAAYCQRHNRIKTYEAIMTKIYRIGLKCYICNMKDKSLSDNQEQEILQIISKIDQMHLYHIRIWDKIKYFGIMHAPFMLRLISRIQK